MTSKVALISVHGMGETKTGYADDLFERVRKMLGPKHSPDLITQSIYYQDVMQQNQVRYLNAVDELVDWKGLRKFMLYGFSDAASLETHKRKPASPYMGSQKAILHAFQQVFTKAGDQPVPVVIVAQSLGGQVITNYLWDANRTATPNVGVWSAPLGLPIAEENFCRGQTVGHLFTTGCNIPLFVAGRPEEEITPIDKENFGPGFRWHNYYDDDDVLGWPLSELSQSYDELVTDVQINAGTFLSGSTTPMSHIRYWKDEDFLEPLVVGLKRFL